MNSVKVLLGTLDPTYSLLPAENRVLPQAPDIRAYLRLSYLFVGDPVIPRTFFIHGLANPLYELYVTSIDGRAEIRDFLTSGVVRVSGHNHSDFRSFSGHYNVTKDEHHPLLVPDNEHLEYAKFLDDCLPANQPELFIWQDFKAVIADFRSVFRDCFLGLTGTDQEFLAIDTNARLALKRRNPYNRIRYPDNAWGRNELCDLLHLNFFKTDESSARVIQAAVAAYQKTFAATVADQNINTKVALTSTQNLRTATKQSDYGAKLLEEIANEEIWEIGLDVLSTRPWPELVQLRHSPGWKQWKDDYEAALSKRDSRAATFAMANQLELLAKLYPPSKLGMVGAAQIVVPNASSTSTTEHGSTSSSEGLVRFVFEGGGTNSQRERWFGLTPSALDASEVSDPIVRSAQRRSLRESRYKYLYDWATRNPFPEVVALSGRVIISGAVLSQKAFTAPKEPSFRPPAQSNRKLSVFLCYASEDRPTVKELSRHLSNAGFAPWLDVEKILPGADWRKSIVAAVETCDAIVLCLSSRAVAKTGYIQTEIRVAMEVADLQPLDAVYIYPVRLDECNILDQFKDVQHADYFASSGLEKLVLALKERARYLKLPLDQSN